ncbi:MAG: cell division protein FtsB [Arenicella sp.]|nr:cell division protein FtsB [Arenicella sp.]
MGIVNANLSIVKILASCLFLLLILLQLQLWFGSHGVFQLWSLRKNIETTESSNNQLVQRNEQLHAEVQQLKKGEEALEERARSQLGFIKDGETFYRVIPDQKLKSAD